jgi:signal transduction histidine kinase
MLCQTFALDQGNITPIWVSFGIAFIWVYVKGFSVLPGIFFGAFFYNLLVSFFQTHPPISSALLAAFMSGTGDMLSMATGVYLMRKFSGGDSILEHVRSASVFIAGAAVLGSLISASFGVTGMWLAGMIPSEFYLSVFTTRIMVDIIGIVVLVPILESIIVRKLNSEFSDRNEEIETMIFLALSALLMYIAITSYGQFASLVAACALVPVLTIYSVRHREFVVTTAAFFLGAYTLAIITLFTPSELADVSLYIHSVQVGLFVIISAMLLIASSVNNINGLNEKVNQQRSRFLANMSHEIRTPMTGVLGLTDMVLKTELSPKQEELIKNIQSSGEMLRQVINDILDQSKLQAGKMEVNEIAFELFSVAETTVSMFGPTAEKQGTILSFDIEAKLPKFVVGDPIRIRQILFNLTSNAIKFTQNGAVEISIERKNEFVRFEVSDTGIGIDENNQKTLFQPFEQLNQDLNREHGGTGLGLSICKSMVEVMGGEIGADNNPGDGSTF